jgi:DNA polymerase (family X)
MSVHNREIIDKLNEVADMLDIKGENPFRVRAYRNAVRTLSGFTGSIAQMVKEEGDISRITGIGKSISEKIEEIVNTGELEQLKNLQEEIPASLVEIMKLEQMGPHRTKILSDALNIKSMDELEQAAKSGKIERVKGFGKKTAETILKEINAYSSKAGSGRYKWSEAEKLVAPFMQFLESKMQDVTIAGSFRRKKETVRDIDIVAVANDPSETMRIFTGYDEVDRILAEGDTKSSVKLRSGLQVDLRIVEKNAFGAALLYFTGSKEHTVALRKMAQENGLKLNEYGLFNKKKLLASKTEEEIYKALNLLYIEPELRENKGEMEASAENGLPRLVSLNDIKGDLHAHTNETDGLNTLREMAEAAKKRGYEYFAITDHSKKVAMAGGLDEKRLEAQIAQIEELNNQVSGIKILKSIEVDILEDGTLDLPDSILKKLDLVVCSVHYHRKLSKQKQTERIRRALNNPYVNILAHPTGRMIGQRNELEMDMEVIMTEARSNGCFLEINCNPDRLDLNDNYTRMAKELGCKISVATDAHSVHSLGYMEYGIAQARRGWLEKNDVINTRTLNELMKLLKR